MLKEHTGNARIGGFALSTNQDTVEKGVFKGFSVLKHTKYLLYSSRMATFNTWPKAMPITAKELAHAGFIYTGYANKVHCPWCSITLYSFETRDSAYEEHLKHSKGCHYLLMTVPDKFTDINGLCPTKGHGLFSKILEYRNTYTHIFSSNQSNCSNYGPTKRSTLSYCHANQIA